MFSPPVPVNASKPIPAMIGAIRAAPWRLFEKAPPPRIRGREVRAPRKRPSRRRSSDVAVPALRAFSTLANVADPRIASQPTPGPRIARDEVAEERAKSHVAGQMIEVEVHSERRHRAPPLAHDDSAGLQPAGAVPVEREDVLTHANVERHQRHAVRRRRPASRAQPPEAAAGRSGVHSLGGTPRAPQPRSRR